MGIFRKVLMNAAGVREDPSVMSGQWKEEQLHPNPDTAGRNAESLMKAKFGGVPAIPSDIGYSSGKETGGVKKSGVISQATSNPGVILGMGLTTLALLGMFRSSFIGDKMGAQKFMQYRIIAQFFTVTALVAGVTIFGATYEDDEHKKKRENVPPPSAILYKQ